MPDLDQSAVRNRLLRLMAPEDFALLAANLEPCQAKKGDILFEKGVPTKTVWFIERGIGSIVTVSPEGLQVESGLFGRDGFAPVGIVMGSDRSPNVGMIQVADDCLRIAAGAFKEVLGQSPGLLDLLLRYAQVLSIQTAYTALSNAVHPIEERLARWLLMCHDRLDDDEMVLTHEFMSIMLAVRRPSVTTSLHVLEGNGFIRADRGCIRIRDRSGLEEFAGDSYGAPEREFTRLIGPLNP